MVKNPLQRIREQHGLSRTEFAVVLGIVSETLRQLERGTLKKLSPSVLLELEKLGHDPGEVEKQMTEWREAYKREIVSKITS